MRNEQHLLDVDVHRRLLRAAERTGTGPTLQDTFDEPEAESLFQRATKFLTRGWEPVTVNKQVDSITMPKWIAVAILGAILTFGIQSWTQRSNDHDAMIRIETKLEAAERAADKSAAIQSGLNGDMQAWRETMNGNLKEIKGMLSQQQLDALGQLKKTDRQNQ